MTPPLRCAGCGHRFSPRARLWVFGPSGLALCGHCGDRDWPQLHRRFWPGCPAAHHPGDHGGVLTSPAGYHYLARKNEQITIGPPKKGQSTP